MAERRMFAKTIIDSDAFLDMPLSTQALYFHLSMRADDEGFINNPKKIQRMIGASEDDLKVLIAKRFIIPFESGIVVIKHWKIHNYIRGDRIKETVYAEEMSMLTTKDNGAYTLIDNVPKVESVQKAETPRQKAYKESSLPYSFEYKIRQAFTGKKCPVCGAIMSTSVDENGIVSENRIPTIQHNIPISKGGKHELGNISVICRQCNVTIQDEETGSLNADEVISVWDDICQSSDSQVTDKCPHRLGKVSIGKDRLVKDSKGKDRNTSCSQLSDESVSPEANVEAVILNDQSEWKPSVELYEEYVRLYPNVDIAKEFRSIRAWCIGNPTKLKTRKGVLRFVNSWLEKAQNRRSASNRGKENVDWMNV